LQEAKNIAHVIGKRIGHDSVRVVETKNGQYKVLTTRPLLKNSIDENQIIFYKKQPSVHEMRE
jgi:hypothetical protein